MRIVWVILPFIHLNLLGLHFEILLNKYSFYFSGGLNALVSQDVIRNDPVPRWVKNLPNAGRNQFTLVNGVGSQRDNDQSVVSSATTVMDATWAELRRDS